MPMSRPTAAALRRLVLVFTMASGLGTGCVNDSGDTSRVCAPLSVTHAAAAASFGGSVFTIVLENHSLRDLLGSADAPFYNKLAQGNAIAAGYHDPYVHPSEPNYIWMVAGENFGILDDDDPSAHHLSSRSHIADQLELAGLSWKNYEESMGAPCGLSSHDSYAVRHNPFVYFDDINGWDGHDFKPSARCIEHVVDYSELATDLARGTLPKYVFISPNLDHDMHDGSVAQGDAWLAAEVPRLLSTDAFQNGGVLFLIGDEGGGRVASDDAPMLVVSPLAKHGYVSDTAYDTSSYLKTVQTILGVEPLPCAAAPATVSIMSDVFSVALTAP